MSDYYVSSVAYAAIPIWVASTAYTVGQIRRPTTALINTSWVFRCTTAGTSSGTQPTWSSAAANNATIVDGGVTWTNVTAQSTYGWGAAAGTLFTIAGSTTSGRTVPGDRVFLSSDHNETNPSGNIIYVQNSSANAFGLIQHISVNRAGSVPPVAADVLSGATITNAGGNTNLDCFTDVYWQGMSFVSTGAGTQLVQFGFSGWKAHYFKNCAFVLNAINASRIGNPANSSKVTFDNCTVQFGNTAQAIVASAAPFDFIWLNTPSALVGATFPAVLFLNPGFAMSSMVTCRGVDLSAVTGTLFNDANNTGWSKLLFDSCKIASGVTRLGSTYNSSANELELVNCHDGTSTLNERYTPAGAVTTDRSTILVGGAQDDIGSYSLKLVSSVRADKYTLPLDGFWFDVENTAIGASKTATIEIISSASLNNDDISLLLEYMGTTGSSVASFASSLPSTVLTAGAALTSSSVTWNNPPGTPVKQKLQVLFTPRIAGRVRGLVRLGKVSTTIWVDPRVVIT